MKFFKKRILMNSLCMEHLISIRLLDDANYYITLPFLVRIPTTAISWYNHFVGWCNLLYNSPLFQFRFIRWCVGGAVGAVGGVLIRLRRTPKISRFSADWAYIYIYIYIYIFCVYILSVYIFSLYIYIYIYIYIISVYTHIYIYIYYTCLTSTAIQDIWRNTK